MSSSSSSSSSHKKKKIEIKIKIDTDFAEKINKTLIDMNRQQHIIWYNIIGHGAHNEPLHYDELIYKMRAHIIYITIVIAGMCAFRLPVIEHAENGLLRDKAKTNYEPFTRDGIPKYSQTQIQGVDVTDKTTRVNYFEFVKICLISYNIEYPQMLKQYKIDNIDRITQDLKKGKKGKQNDNLDNLIENDEKLILGNLQKVIEKAEQKNHADMQPVINNRYFFDPDILGDDNYLENYRPDENEKLEFSMIGPITTNNQELNKLFAGNNFNFVSINNILEFTAAALTGEDEYKSAILNELLLKVITILADIDIFNLQEILNDGVVVDMWLSNISTEELLILTFLFFNIEFMEIIHECINKYLTETDNKNKRIKHLKQGYHLFIEQIFKPCNNTSYILTTSACRYDTSLSFKDSIYHHHTNPDTVATQDVDRELEFEIENNGRVSRKKRKEPEPEPEPNTSFGVSTTRRKKKRRFLINTIKQKRRKHAKKKKTRKRKTRKRKR